MQWKLGETARKLCPKGSELLFHLVSVCDWRRLIKPQDNSSLQLKHFPLMHLHLWTDVLLLFLTECCQNQRESQEVWGKKRDLTMYVVLPPFQHVHVNKHEVEHSSSQWNNMVLGVGYLSMCLWCYPSFPPSLSPPVSYQSLGCPIQVKSKTQKTSWKQL